MTCRNTENMSLREKILKTFIVTIREINMHGGPTDFFKKYPVGGMFYSECERVLDENGREIGTALTPEKLSECKRASSYPLLVCADFVNAKGQKTDMYVQRSLGSSGCIEDAYTWGKINGMQMNDKGIDWVLAPSIDMCVDHLMYLTAICDNPQKTASIYREVVRGIQDQGVCATAKHFPGLGTYFVNMHISPGTNNLPFDKWMKTYGYTYKEMIDEGVMSIMTTHVSLKSYDNEYTDGYCPIATYSKKLTTELLKEKLGFKGVVVTDALVMGGMAAGNLVAETVQAFKAGADMLLWPPVEAAEAIEEKILDGEIPMSRLDDALIRIERMRNFKKDKNPEKPDPEYIDKKLIEIARNGMCMLRNNINLLPINADSCKKILIVDVTDEDEASSNVLMEELEKYGIKAEVKRDIYDAASCVCWQSDIDRLQEKYDLVIFNVNAFFAAEWSEAHMLIWASHLFNKEKKLIVNYGSPFFASDYFPEDPTVIEMNCRPSRETVRLLVKGLMGETEFTGKPVLSELNVRNYA